MGRIIGESVGAVKRKLIKTAEAAENHIPDVALSAKAAQRAPTMAMLVCSGKPGDPRGESPFDLLHAKDGKGTEPIAAVGLRET